MAPVLPRAVAEFVEETVASAPPMSDELRADLRQIIWGWQDPVPRAGEAA